ncbi:hypothetical protein AB1N83_010895 [Pleurotus pulmonarius]
MTPLNNQGLRAPQRRQHNNGWRRNGTGTPRLDAYRAGNELALGWDLGSTRRLTHSKCFQCRSGESTRSSPRAGVGRREDAAHPLAASVRCVHYAVVQGLTRVFVDTSIYQV